RSLLRALAGPLDAKAPRGAIDRARRVVEENKRLRNELGKLRAGDRAALIDDLVTQADDVDGLALIVGDVRSLDPGELRELAIKVRDRLQERPAAVVVGNADGK